eukprot:8566357-Pyramimonas_sp.AAC.2
MHAAAAPQLCGVRKRPAMYVWQWSDRLHKNIVSALPARHMSMPTSSRNAYDTVSTSLMIRILRMADQPFSSVLVPHIYMRYIYNYIANTLMSRASTVLGLAYIIGVL